MFCCATVIGGIAFILFFIGILAKKRKSSRLQARVNTLKDKANSWEDNEIEDFDPKNVLKETDFNIMTERLKNRIIIPNLEEPDNSPYGTPATYVNHVADHLVNAFDFSQVLNVLCQFKHFKTKIGDINLHFIHIVGSEEKRSTPIILLHGWPSTVWEFHKSIPKLVEQGYTVVAPSLPGHGFTDPPNVTGVSPSVMACAYHKLMHKLGYKRFVIHGGDWGAIIGSLLTYMYPESVIGLHNTMNHMNFGWRQILQSLIGAVLPSLVYTTEQEKKFIHPMFKFGERMYRSFAYFHIQSVLPDSYGYGMVDSPVGLIGWIGSRFVLWSANRYNNITEIWKEGVENFGMNNICANLTIFWLQRNALCSMRIYYEFYWNDLELLRNFSIPNVPVAISNFPNEIIHLTKFASKTTFNNIKQYNYHKHGGHFAHIDNTDGVVGDLTSFIQKLK
ncbi:hypothetical protein ACHWQZ_G007025 [Mnemiopsis leidyi]